MKREEFDKVLRLHEMWLEDRRTGKRAIFCDEDFIDTNLSGENLELAIFEHCSICNSDMTGTILKFASFNDTVIRDSNFTGANLYRSHISNTSINYSDFTDVNLEDCFILDALFYKTCLKNANVKDASVLETGFTDIEGMPELPMDLLEGEFIGYKKVNDKYIVKLKILEDSKRSRGSSYKCRCDKALVLEIQNIDGTNSGMSELKNDNSPVPTVYNVGEIVRADDFDENRWCECSYGIHFYLDRQRAVEYKCFTIGKFKQRASILNGDS